MYFFVVIHSFCKNECVRMCVRTEQHIVPSVCLLQEKKGQPPMDRAQRVEYEINKLNKILCTVREQPTVPNQ